MAQDQQAVEKHLQHARRMLEVARIGERDFRSRTVDRQTSGMYQAFTSGRSVLQILQRLKRRVDGWAEFWTPEQRRMDADPLFQWWIDVRNRIEKEGTPGAGGAAYFGGPAGLDPLLKLLSDAEPPGAVGTFLMDSLGRCGWVVVGPDGDEYEVYYGAPQGVTFTTLYLDDAPGGISVEAALARYLCEIEALLERAEQRFLQ